MVKKPIILCSDAMNYVLFLVCDRAIHAASKSDSGSQVGEYTSTLGMLVLTYTVCYLSILNYEQKYADDDSITGGKLSYIVKEKIFDSLCWAALYAAIATLCLPVEATMRDYHEMNDEGARWMLVVTVGCVATMIALAGRVINIFYSTLCCCLSKCTQLGGAKDSIARHNAGVSLSGILLSALAWLLAATWLKAIDASIVARTCGVATVQCPRHVLWSWLTAFMVILIALLVLHCNRRILATMYLESASSEIKADDSSGRKKNAPSFRAQVIELMDQAMIFIGISSIKTAVRVTLKDTYSGDGVAQETALLTCVVFFIIFATFAGLALQAFLRSKVSAKKDAFELLYLAKICEFLNRGLSYSLGQMFFDGSVGLLAQPSGYGPELTFNQRWGIFAGVVVTCAVLMTTLMAWLPGDVQFIYLSPEMLGEAADANTELANKPKRLEV